MHTVFIADDEAIERKYLHNIFQKRPKQYSVVGEASNGKEAVSLVYQVKPSIVIMDISMPLLNGLDAALLIKERYPDTIILLNTAYAEFEFARKAVEYRLDAYLLKPSSEDTIFQTIDSCIQAGKTAQDNSQPPSHPDSRSCTDIVAEYITEHYQRNILLGELADLVHFSPSYLSYLFHQERGMTIKTFINQQRIEQAVYLLLHSRMSVKEISCTCGFTNISHFNRVFKQQTNKSPAEIRKDGLL